MSDFDMPTNNEFKHNLRLQLNDWKEILKYLSNNELEKLKEKTTIMIETIEKSLQD